MRRLGASLLLAALMGACAADSPPEGLAGARSSLTATERQARATLIRDVVRARGGSYGLLLAGIAMNETGLAHCWSEATWACQGPPSPDCGGGPVIAGRFDGDCSLMEGGLGMFQFDAGTYEETLARDGERVLSLQGNVEAAIDFVVSMVIRSRYIDGVSTEEEALVFLDAVRPWNAFWRPWNETLAHYYNGCNPDWCTAFETKVDNYATAGEQMLIEIGPQFWYETSPACGPIPREGAIVDDTDPCFAAGGDPLYWRSESEGYGGGLLWTNATASDTPANHAFWFLSFLEPGWYLVEVHTDAAFAQSAQAPYRIRYDGAQETVVLDQTASDGFQPLGAFPFAAGGDQYVRLDDNSGEPVADQVHIAADALRLTRLPQAHPPALAPRPLAEEVTGGGCAAGGIPAPGGGALLLGFVAAWARRRRLGLRE